MNKINLGESRYGDERYLHEIDSNKYSTEGFERVAYVRIGQDDHNDGEYTFIDFDGGPMLTVGTKITENKVIKSIVFEDGRYILITEEVNDEES